MPEATATPGKAFGASLAAGAVCLAAIRFPPLAATAATLTAANIYIRAAGRVLAAGPGGEDKPQPPEPAYRQYFFSKAFADLNLTAADARRALTTTVQAGSAWLEKSIPKDWNFVSPPLRVVGFVAAVCVAVPLVAFTVIHLAAVCVLAAVAFLLAAAFRTLETFNLVRRGIFIACPHGGCFRKIPLPVYQCPQCGAEHRHLVPGRYGVFQRRCQCGRKLPTLFLFGRHHLPSRCPHPNCGRPLPGAPPVRTYHFPIVGGASTGKSSFLMAALAELQDLKIPALQFEPVGQQRAISLAEARKAFEEGLVLKKTAELTPDAFLARMTGANPGLLYFYDAAGELFQGSDAILSHQHLTYASGILFLIDPFSLPLVQANLNSEVRSLTSQIRPSEEDPAHVYSRLISAMRNLVGKDRFKSVPVAVVLTKADAGPMPSVLTPAEAARGAEVRSAAIRRWLVDNGQSNLVTLLDQDFGNVRYFLASALGRVPEVSAGALRPRGVLPPILWLFEANRMELPSALLTS